VFIKPFKTSKLQNFKTSKLQNFKTSKLQNFKTSKLQNFKTSKLHMCPLMTRVVVDRLSCSYTTGDWLVCLRSMQIFPAVWLRIFLLD